jgi:hypothetical protein
MMFYRECLRLSLLLLLQEIASRNAAHLPLWQARPVKGHGSCNTGGMHAMPWNCMFLIWRE